MPNILERVDVLFAEAHTDVDCILHGTLPLYVPDEADNERAREQEERLHALLTTLKNTVIQLTVVDKQPIL